MTHFVEVEVLVGSDPSLNNSLGDFGGPISSGTSCRTEHIDFSAMTRFHLAIQQKIQVSDKFKCLKYKSTGTSGVAEFGPQHSKVVAYRVTWGKITTNAQA